jgi:SAM-dependent methyltransferase
MSKVTLTERFRLAIQVLQEPRRIHDRVFVHEHPSLERVERVEELLQLAKGRQVLHFGFLDSPFLAEKHKSGDMLHERLKVDAASVFGVDINERDLDTYRRLSGDTANCILDISAPDAAVHLLDQVPFDVILFPEVLEHIPDPGQALRNLKRLCVPHHARLVLTVPNAFNFNFFVEACAGREIVHPDHLFYFSPTTLERLVSTSGFRVLSMKQYGPKGAPREPGITEAGLVCVCEAAG